MAAASGSVNGYLSSTDWTTFNGKQNALGNASASVNGILTSTDWTTFNNKQNTLTNPVTGTGTTNTLPLFTGTSTLGNSVIQESSGNIGIGVAPIANLTFDVAKNILLKSGSTGIASILFSETGTPSATDVEFGGILRYNGGLNLDRMELITRDNLSGSNVTNIGLTMDRVTGNIGLLKPTTISSTLTVTGAITEGGNNVMTNLDTVSLSNRIDAKLNKTDTAYLSTRIDLKLNKTDTASLSSRIDAKLSPSDTVSLSNRIDLKLNKTDTASLSSRIDLKLNKTDTASLSSRIDGKVSLTGDQTISGNKTLSGNTIMNGTVTMSSTSATPTGLIGINASNLIGDITTVAQTGIFARGLVTNQTTSTGGVITIEHGLNFTPSMAFANLPDSTTKIVNVAVVDATYILFVVRDGATNNVLNTQNVPAIQWFAVK
jgi:hypothetical protein